jgi:CO dehydrogenase/acetyl-CoA synthase alpha subunit
MACTLGIFLSKYILKGRSSNLCRTVLLFCCPGASSFYAAHTRHAMMDAHLGTDQRMENGHLCLPAFFRAAVR